MPLHPRRHRTLLALALVALAVGCEPGPDEAPAVETVTPVTGGTIHYAQIAPSTLDPAIVYDSFDASLVNLIHAGLLRHDRNFGIRPDVARTWTIEEGGHLYRFALRADVRFHDGRTLEAYDVAHSLHRVFDRDEAAAELARQYLGVIEGVDDYVAGRAESISGIEVVDAQHLDIRLARPYAAFLNVMASEFARVVPRPRGKAATDVAIGCGPFALEEWIENDRIVLRRHDDYHAGPVYVDGVVVHTPAAFRSEQALEDFLRGDHQLVELTTMGTARVEDDPGVELQRRLELSLTFLAMTVDQPPFDDVRVRRALAHGIDVASLYSVDGAVKPVATSILPPGFPGYEPGDKRLPHDPELARALIEEVGPLERPIRLGVPRRGPAVERFAEELGAQVEDLGLAVDIVVVDWNDFSRGLRTGAFDAFFLTWVADIPDADSFYYPLFHSDGSANHLHYDDESVDAWLHAARGEVDQVRRMELYRRVEQRVLEDAVIVPLHFNSTVIAVRKELEGFEITSMGSAQLRLESVWLDPPSGGLAR